MSLVAFKYYGGKATHLKELLPLLPTCHHYVEPFCGSAAVLLNRNPSECETINDADGRIVNFFRVLRDREDELLRAIQLTPYSREEYMAAGDIAADPVEEARRWFVRAQQCHTSELHGGWNYVTQKNNRWPASTFARKGLDVLPVVVDRIRNCQIENGDFEEVMRRYDTPRTLFYCDPPYPRESRNCVGDYRHDTRDELHERLAKVAGEMRGMVAISGYDCELYGKLFREPNWQLTRLREKACCASRAVNGKKTLRQECLWTNYRPAHKNLEFDW